MQKFLLALTVPALLVSFSAPVLAAPVADAGIHGAFDLNLDFDKRGRGKGKVRVPGGSGCDDPQDLIEHPECRV